MCIDQLTAASADHKLNPYFADHDYCRFDLFYYSIEMGV